VAIHDPETPEELVDPILQGAEEATDTLLVYYAGHGIKGANGGEFRLSRSTSRAGAPHTSINYNDIREALIGSAAARRIVILDCCYAGSALGVMADPDHSIIDAAQIEGTYVIAAAGETEPAIAEDGSGFTAFTGELVRLIREGVPDSSMKFMDLDTVFSCLLNSLRAKARPLPHRRVRNSPGGLALARNKKWEGFADHPDRETATKVDSGLTAPHKVTPGIPERPGVWPRTESSAPEFHPAPPVSLAGRWPTAGKAKFSSVAADEEYSASGEQSGALSALGASSTVTPEIAAAEIRPGSWPTSKQAAASSAVSDGTLPVVGALPGAWPVSDGAVPPTALEATTIQPQRAVWPAVKQPPQKATSPRLPTAQELWPEILEAVKERRRFAWILLSQNSEITHFDGRVIQLEFIDAASKRNYLNSGVATVLAEVIRQKFKASWQVEVNDRQSMKPSGGSVSDVKVSHLDGWPAAVADNTNKSQRGARRPGEWPEGIKPKARSKLPSGLAEFQQLWPQVLEKVKERRRFAWILLSQNAGVTGFDGYQLQLAFSSSSAREHYLAAGANAVLEEMLHEMFDARLGVDVVTVIDEEGSASRRGGIEAVKGSAFVRGSSSKRLTQTLICFVEWVNAPVLSFPTTSILRDIVNDVLREPKISETPVHRRDGNGKSVLIFDLDANGQEAPSPHRSSASLVRILLEDLDKLMANFCQGEVFEKPYPQLRFFAHEEPLTFDGTDYTGSALKKIDSICRGLPVEDYLVGDFPGVIAIVSSSVYEEKILAPSPHSSFEEWVGVQVSRGTDSMHLSVRAPR
jgi:hypothetical protein